MRKESAERSILVSHFLDMTLNIFKWRINKSGEPKLVLCAQKHFNGWKSAFISLMTRLSRWKVKTEEQWKQTNIPKQIMNMPLHVPALHYWRTTIQRKHFEDFLCGKYMTKTWKLLIRGRNFREVLVGYF